MYYTIYRITNKVNGKIYVGKHQTVNLDDGYMGSGKMIRRAIKKHGVENFEKEILFIFDNEDEMNRKEAEIVDEAFYLREDNYNLCVGGKGGNGWIYANSKGGNGWTYANSSWKSVLIQEQRKRNPNMQRKLSSLGGKKTSLTRLEQGLTPWGQIPGSVWTNRKHTDETRTKISCSMKKLDTSGEKNSQYGTTWITDGNVNKKIHKSQFVPEGWRKGRICK